MYQVLSIQLKIPILKTELNASDDRVILGTDTWWQASALPKQGFCLRKQEKGKLIIAGVSEKFGIEAVQFLLWFLFLGK